jgi:hypothetical protein
VELDPNDPRPVWLLDVDGVLNTSRNAWREAPHNATVTWNGVRGMPMGYKFHWSPTLLRRIHRVRSDRLVELVWCTTWCAEAQKVEAVFKLPPLKRAFTCYTKSQIDAWNYKVEAADKVLAAGRRLIWTDDDIPTFGPLRERFDRPDALVITTVARRGLTPDDMARIEAFATLNTKVAEYRMETAR